MPTPQHPDITLRNLLIQETGGPQLVSLSNWQHAIVAPYFTQAHFPQMLQYDGTSNFSIMLELPDLMSDFPQEEQGLYRWDLELVFHQKVNEKLLIFGSSHEGCEACMQPFLSQLWNLPHEVVQSWMDSLLPLQWTLLELQDDWNSVAWQGMQYPTVFYKAKIQQHQGEDEWYVEYQ